MGKRRGWVNKELGPNGSALDPLTEEELTLQAEISETLREDLESILEINNRHLGMNTENTALMLSGGMESLAILFSLLKIGVRPTILSYRGAGEKPSSDFRKAKQVAEFYDLPFHEVSLPDDPEIFYEYTTNAIFNRNLKTRPDIEVSFLYYNVYLKAKEVGVTYVYSGVDEGNLIGLGRKYEIPGRYGKLSSVARLLNHTKLIGGNSEQKYSFASEANLNGLVLLTPMSTWGSLLTLADVPYRLSNLPRKKSIMSRAYQKELDETGVVVQVSPMQVRDASPRDKYNEYIRTSEGVKEKTRLAGVTGIDTAHKWYNFLKKQAGRPVQSSMADDGVDGVIGEAQEAFANYAFTGAEIPEDLVELGVSTSGIDVDYLDDFFDTSPLINLEEDEVEEKEEDYAPETLEFTDCTGTPLKSPYSMDLCPRARAGLCNHNPLAGETLGKHDDGSYDIKLCGLARLAVDSGLDGEYRSAEYNHLWGFNPDVTKMHLELYKFITDRNLDRINERKRILLDRLGDDPYGNGSEPGVFRHPDGSEYPPLGTLEGYPATGSDGVDWDLFVKDTVVEEDE